MTSPEESVLPLQPDPLVELAARLAKRSIAVTDATIKADLLCRLGLLCWDVLGDLEASAKYLSEAGNEHPEAVRLRLHLAIHDGDQQALRVLQQEVGTALIDREAAALFYRVVAETWLFHFDDTDEATKAAREALRRNPGDTNARAILTLALELATNQDNLVKHLRTASTADIGAHRRYTVVIGDHLGQLEEASKALRRLRGKAEDDPYLLERIWELSESGEELALPPKDMGVALLRKKIELLGEPSAVVERNAVRFRLAQLLLRNETDAPEGEQLLRELSQGEGTWGPVLALHVRRARAARRRAPKDLAETYLSLGDRCMAPGFREAYLLRAAELFESADMMDRAIGTYQNLLVSSPDNSVAMDATERLLLKNQRYNDLIELYEVAARHFPQRSGDLLKRAAHIAESRLKDPAEASRLRRPTIERLPEPETLGELARIFRGGRDLQALFRVYVQSAGVLRDAGDTRRSALYASAAGSVALALGDTGSAEKHLADALENTPNDLFAHAALMGLYRRVGKWRELVLTVERELELEQADGERARLHADIARIAMEHLEDLALAKQHLTKATELSPEDPSLCHLLAQVYDHLKNHEQAIKLRRKAVEGFGSSFRAAVLLCEIGEIYTRQLGEDDKAEAAFKEALDVDDEMEAAMEGLGSLYRRQARYADLLAIFQQRLEVVEDSSVLSLLHLEMGDVAEHNLRDDDTALEHFHRALALCPGSGQALNSLERLCRRLNRFDVLGEVLPMDTEDPAARRLLAEALDRLGRWDDLRSILDAELVRTTDQEQVASVSMRLAEVLEQRLSDPMGALVYVKRAVDASPKDTARLERYWRLSDGHGSASDRLDALQRLLATLPSEDPRRRDLVARMGELLLEAPKRLDEATRVLEDGLQLAPDHVKMMDLLAQAYEAQGRQDELIAILRRRSDVPGERSERASVLLRAAVLHEDRDEHNEALDALVGAFRLDPSNRETFTRTERLCYRLKRWREVMEVYDVAIDLVTERKSRAYRLADLYARRGQLQLQYLSQTGEAASSYLKVLELDPGNDTALKFLESIFSKEGDWGGLIKAYEQRAGLLPDPPRKVETLRRAARVAAAKLKDPEEAARHYEMIHSLQPEDGEALDALERYFERTRNWEKLVAILLARMGQITRREEMLPLHLRIANIYEEGLRNVDSAVDSYKKVLDQAPGHREALEALSRIYEATERWAEFIDITRRQVKITQDRAAKALLFFKCGSVMEAKFSKSDDAIRYYEAAIKTSSGCLPAVHGLRDLYLRREEWPRVLDTLELEVKLWQEDKERAGVFARMGRIYEEHLHDLDKAVEYYESALSVDSECMPAIRALFDVAFKREDWEKASRLSQNLSQKALREGEPALRSDFYLKRGMVADHAGALVQAAENFVVALEIRPDNLPALDALIELCRRRPGAYDYISAFRGLEKVYQRRDWPEAQARVLIARGTLAEHEGGHDAALRDYAAAIELAPGDFRVLRPMISLLVLLRRVDEALEHIERFAAKVEPGTAAWADALLYASDLQSNVLMDSRRAVATLRVLLKRQAKNREALYRHAQELMVQGRPSEAKVVCERLIEVAADPKNTASPIELGRYYYYLGHVTETEGDDKACTSAYRRSLDLAPGYPPASIALARRHAQRGALPQAEALLGNSARIAQEQGRQADALRLRRELGTFQARTGSLSAALAELRTVVGDPECSLDDRLALADLHALDEANRPRAIDDLRAMLAIQPDHLPAIRRLVELTTTMEPVGRLRVLRAARLLGLAKAGDLAELERLEAAHPPPSGILTDELRAQRLAVDEVRGPLGQMWQTIHEQLERLYPVSLGSEALRYLDPATDGVDPRAIALRLGFPPEGFGVVIAEASPHLAWVAFEPKPTIVLHGSLLTGAPSETTFLVARCLEYLRSNFSLLARLGPRERQELGLLLKAIAKPADQREPSASDFMALLSRQQVKAVERVAKAAGDIIPDLDVLSWMRGVDTLMSQVGLLLVDDIAAASRISARLGKVDTAILSDGRIVLRALQGGQNLLRFYLSAHYDALCGAMASVQQEVSDKV